MHNYAQLCKISIFPKLTKTNLIGILYDLAYFLFFLGGLGNVEGWGAMDMRREFKGLTCGVG